MSALAGRLLALDIDGTLLRSDGTVGERTIAAAAAAREAGATLTIATGRDWSGVVHLLERVPALDYSLCVNGIEVFRSSGEELHAFELDATVARAAIEQIRNVVPGVEIGIGMAGELVLEPGIQAAMPVDVGDVREVEDIVTALGPGLRDVVIHHADYTDDLDTLFELVASALPTEGVDAAYTGLPMVELVPPGCGKHTGLGWLSSHLGIDQSNVVVFGDGLNDLSMLRWAGRGVAMGQAVAKVHDAADEVTDTNDEEGIATWIEARLG